MRAWAKELEAGLAARAARAAEVDMEMQAARSSAEVEAARAWEADMEAWAARISADVARAEAWCLAALQQAAQKSEEEARVAVQEASALDVQATPAVIEASPPTPPFSWQTDPGYPDWVGISQSKAVPGFKSTWRANF